MADTKISGLAQLTAAAAADILAIVDIAPAPTTKYITVANLFNPLASPIEIEVASTATALTVTQPAAASWQVLMRGETADAAAGDFTWVLDGTPTFNGTRDNCLFWGYNVKSQGVREDTSEPTLHFGLESNYNTGATNLMEYYSQFTSADGLTTYRPYQLNVVRSAPTDGITHSFLLHPTINSSFNINRADTNATVFNFLGSGVMLFHTNNANIQFLGSLPWIQATTNTPIIISANAKYIWVSNAVDGIEFGVDRDTNIYRNAANTLKTDDKLIVAGELNPTAAFNHDGSTFGALGVAPAAQRAHIADPSGGATTDAEARTAINAILVTLETFGFHAAA